MSAETSNKKSIISIELPDSIDNAAKNLTDKPTATIGETISDCLFLVFGGLNQKAAIKRVQYSVELEKFKNELEEKLNSIPEENRGEVNTHTVCTALDNMRYCVEEKDLRDMFTSLIANSVDSEKADAVHPSYGEIIKQLSGFDALVLKDIISHEIRPILTINVMTTNFSETPAFKNLIWDTFGDENKIGTTIDNLARLKLIDITYGRPYTNKSCYEDLKNKSHIASIIKGIEPELKKEGYKLSFSQGVIAITDYGKNFYKACS